jgi:glycosyltransferase EpsD
MPRVLICASTASHINNFHLPYLNYFKEKGFEVHVAVPDPSNIKDADFTHVLPMAKSFISPKNLSAIWMLQKLIRSYRFELIMTHATLANAIGRVSLFLAGKTNSRIMCTVHGYLFWNGCGFLKRLAYYTPELLLRGITDCIITMNDEDAQTAQKLVKKGGYSVKIKGMGVDSSRYFPFSDEEKQKARQDLSIPVDAFVLVYAAEFSKRKNHNELLNAMVKIVNSVPSSLLLLCGTGALLDDIRAAVHRLMLNSNVIFLGYRNDMDDVYKACDMSVSTSKSEGLPFNIIEAQLCALPVAASKIRGHTDLVIDEKTGLLYPPGDINALAGAAIRLYKDPSFRKELGISAAKSAKEYSLEEIFTENTKVYDMLVNALLS